ncbi:MAG: hypothetical protein EAZ77_17700 [Nostocales cyanobacterium]|nr:MAG: hypothetical protein EAZ77_17700 [Nostocales cyanobacterium]
MKLLVPWGITFGLVGTTLLGAVFGGSTPVLALPEQEIKDKLDAVPVYLITNEKGVPLRRSLPNNQDGKKNGGSVTGVYMSRQDAKDFLNELQNAKGKDPKGDSNFKREE